MMKIGKQKLNFEQKLLVLLFDGIQIIAYKQGHKKGAPKPQSLFKKLTEERRKDDLMAFNSADSFEAWHEMKMKG